jgi:hypothetical protein
MIAPDSALRVVVTRPVHDWAELDPDRLTWLAGCLRRRAAADWGDLDRDAWAANDAAVRHGCGRLLSVYPLPHHVAGTAIEDRLWAITDDLEDPDTATTILWPSDYERPTDAT